MCVCVPMDSFTHCASHEGVLQVRMVNERVHGHHIHLRIVNLTLMILKQMFAIERLCSAVKETSVASWIGHVPL